MNPIRQPSPVPRASSDRTRTRWLRLDGSTDEYRRGNALRRRCSVRDVAERRGLAPESGTGTEQDDAARSSTSNLCTRFRSIGPSFQQAGIVVDQLVHRRPPSNDVRRPTAEIDHPGLGSSTLDDVSREGDESSAAIEYESVRGRDEFARDRQDSVRVRYGLRFPGPVSLRWRSPELSTRADRSSRPARRSTRSLDAARRASRTSPIATTAGRVSSTVR